MWQTQSVRQQRTSEQAAKILRTRAFEATCKQKHGQRQLMTTAMTRSSFAFQRSNTRAFRNVHSLVDLEEGRQQRKAVKGLRCVLGSLGQQQVGDRPHQNRHGLDANLLGLKVLPDGFGGGECKLGGRSQLRHNVMAAARWAKQNSHLVCRLRHKKRCRSSNAGGCSQMTAVASGS